ncbi:hypothetical protein FNT36_24990 [Hymenobacter setariae]|uniref:DUF3408 domain-containing protein n=1 Tax=Hymenobacter setariae TaxID=2594794 RepID=A0A558BJV0_9BACT|nr:hypothetical protein [Hymenobacter setariae]TVT36773.1 hypothetical protein FNT36_24990 [Hymenobacter setariae]
MAKPKPKSQAEKDADLQKMLEAAATSNDLIDGGGASAPPAPAAPVAAPAPVASSVEPTATVEQKGEFASVASAPPPAPTAAVVAEPVATSVPVPLPAPAAESEPTPETAPAPAAEPVPAPKLVVTSAPTVTTEDTSVPKVETVPEKEPSAKSAPEAAASVEAATDGEPMSFNLASLFEKSADKKTWVVRITESHQEYLSLLGTVVGGGASIPDMVHNIISQFISAHDAELQKALQKKLRQRTGKRL